MIKRMRIGIRIIFLMLCILVLPACGADRNQVNVSNGSEEIIVQQDEMLPISLYFVNKDWTEYINETLYLDQLTTTENVIDSVMNNLITPKEEGEAKLPVPGGMAYQRYTFDGEGNITLVFNVDYESTDSYQLLICKSAFVKTLCQIDGVDTVTFELVDLLNDQEVRDEVYDVEDFVFLNDALVKTNE